MRIVCVLVYLLAAEGFAKENQPSEIAAYLGKDVRKMDAGVKQNFIKLFRSVCENDRVLDEKDWEFVPQTLYEFADPSFRCFLEIAPGFIKPGFCGLRVHVFDDDWRAVRRDVFSTGYRQEIIDAYQLREKTLGTNLLVIKTIRAGERKERGTPEKYQLQYYAAANGQLMLVRREDERGQLVLNNYSGRSVPEIGMIHPKGPSQELLGILRSGTAPQRLALLAWCAGRHMSSEVERVGGASQEPVESSRAFEVLRDSDKFDDYVGALRKSGNQWIRAYALQIQIDHKKVDGGKR